MIKLLLIIALLISSSLSAKTIDVVKEGAKGDGITDNTVIFQQVIDNCSLLGGGTIYVPSGTYLIRPLELKSNIHIHLELGATLLGSNCLADYDHAFLYPAGTMNQTSGLLYARDKINISLTGLGVIDGQGGSTTFQFGNDGDGGPKRPKLLYLVECKGITVQDLTFRNSAYWVQHYERCGNLQIRGIKIFSHCNYNNDGIDIDAKNVTISDCYIDVEDDAICLKSDHSEFCENVTITNCVVASNCNGIKLGTASLGGFRNIAISNCVVHRASEDNIRRWSTTIQHVKADVTVLAGVAIEMVDGGIIDGVTVSNITMRDVQTPIFIRLGDRKRVFHKGGGILKNIFISDIVARAESLIASSITGVPGHCVENVSISNVNISYPGGGTREMAERQVPEQVKDYPENRMFGHTLPAAAFYVRHARNVDFHNVKVYADTPDARPLFVFEKVQRSPETEGLLNALKQVPQKGFMFGHHDAPIYGIGWEGEQDRSDVKSVCGAYPAVMSFDLGGIELGSDQNLDKVSFDVIRKEVIKQYQRGGMSTFSWHVYNPLTGKDSWDISNANTVSSILPGGAEYSKFQGYLDKVADFLKSITTSAGVTVPILFRPWHEHTGNWFWWGKNFCTVQQYKALWQMTYDHFEEKGVRNVLFAYSPDASPKNSFEYLERYPGDEIVDLIGVDIYQSNSQQYKADLERGLRILAEVGKEHQKPIALTETGYETIPDPVWWTQTLLPVIEKYPVSYVVVWRNAREKENHYYAPYPGQISAKDFKKFYKSSKTLFIGDNFKLGR